LNAPHLPASAVMYKSAEESAPSLIILFSRAPALPLIKFILFYKYHTKETAILMAAYILNQMPDVKTIDIDTTGNMEDTIFLKE